jgi:hypothetical protein
MIRNECVMGLERGLGITPVNEIRRGVRLARGARPPEGCEW